LAPLQHWEPPEQAAPTWRQAQLPATQLRLQHSRLLLQDVPVWVHAQVLPLQVPLQQSDVVWHVPEPQAQKPPVQTSLKHWFAAVQACPNPTPPQTWLVQDPPQH
jgi:hypothetical protein